MSIHRKLVRNEGQHAAKARRLHGYIVGLVSELRSTIVDGNYHTRGRLLSSSLDLPGCAETIGANRVGRPHGSAGDAAMICYSILALVVVAALGNLGVQTASLLAVLGAAGLGVGLALQGTLTNIAAGIMLLWLRPFRVGDYIEVPSNNISGTVKEIGLFVCQLENFEGIFVFAPNGVVWNTALRNYSRNSGRLISFTVRLPSSTPMEKARETLKSMIDEDPRILKNPSPAIFVESYDASKGLVWTCSFRTTQGHAGEVQRDLIDEVTRRLEQAGIGKADQIVRTVPAYTDPSRVICRVTCEAQANLVCP
jgi:small conductance mechanosensitive channel